MLHSTRSAPFASAFAFASRNGAYTLPISSSRARNVRGIESRDIQPSAWGSTPESSSTQSTQAVTRGASSRAMAEGVGSKPTSWVSWP